MILIHFHNIETNVSIKLCHDKLTQTEQKLIYQQHQQFSLRLELTFGLDRLLPRVELTADVHQPPLQLHLLLQSDLLPRLARHVLTGCWHREQWSEPGEVTAARATWARRENRLA